MIIKYVYLSMDVFFLITIYFHNLDNLQCTK